MSNFIKVCTTKGNTYILINIDYIIKIIEYDNGCTIFLNDNRFGIDVKESGEQIEKLLNFYSKIYDNKNNLS